MSLRVVSLSLRGYHGPTQGEMVLSKLHGQHGETERKEIRWPVRRQTGLANKAILGKGPKTTWLWQSAVTKPLQLQNIMAYPWKDNVHIFHLAPSFSESSHQCSCGDFLRKVASCGKIQIWRNISSSFVLNGWMLGKHGTSKTTFSNDQPRKYAFLLFKKCLKA